MSVVGWAHENYHARSVYRRALATGIVTFVEWALSALLALLGLVVIYLGFEWGRIDVGAQMLNVLWVGLTVLVLSRLWGSMGRPEPDS